MGRGHSTGKLQGANVLAAFISLSNNKSFIFLPQNLICKSPSNTTVHSKIPLNPTPHILDILLTQCLRTAAPKPEVLLFIRKKLYQ
jgi:hypothetical protein